MSLNRMIVVVGVSGAVTALALMVGLTTIGGLAALVQLGGLVGAPLSFVLSRQLRSPSVAVVVAIALSMALTAIAAQSLIWFGVATDVLLVVVATAYGCILAALLGDDDEIIEAA